MNDLQSIAHGCSEKAYSARTTSAANPHITDKAGLDEQMKIVKNSSGAGLLNIKGIGKHAGSGSERLLTWLFRIG